MSRIRADQLVNRAGSGGPKFPHGVADGFSVSGIVTATSFAGNLTGNVTGNLTGNVTGNADTATTATNAQGLTGTPNITVGTIGCGNVTSTGDVTGVNATFSGNLTVQGTTSTIDTVVTAVDSLNVEGSVGIGTTTPNYKLEIDGDVGIRNNSESDLYFDVDYGNGTTSSAAIFSYPTRFGIKQGGNSRADNYIFYYYQHASTAADDYIYLQCGDAERLRITGSGNVGINSTSPATTLDVDGTISDSIGPLRRLGINAQTGAYTVTTTDAGKLIRINNTGNITIPTGLSPGDMVSIVSHHASTNTIVQGSGLTLYNTADGSTGNRTLAARGVCTILWSHTDTAYISGSGLS